MAENEEFEAEQMPVAHVDLAGLLNKQLSGTSYAAQRFLSRSPGSASPDEASESSSPPTLPAAAPTQGLSKTASFSENISSGSSRRGSGGTFLSSLTALSTAVSALHATSTAVAAEHSSQGKGGVLLTESDVSALMQAIEQLKVSAPTSSKPRKQRRETSVSLGLSRVTSSHSFGEEDSLLETFDAQPHIFDDATKDAVIGFLSPRVIRAQAHDSPRRRRSTHTSQRRVSLVSTPTDSSRSFAAAIRMAFVDSKSDVAVQTALEQCPLEREFIQGIDSWGFDVLVRSKALQASYDALSAQRSQAAPASTRSAPSMQSSAAREGCPSPVQEESAAPPQAAQPPPAPPRSKAAAGNAPPQAPPQEAPQAITLAAHLPSAAVDGFEDDVVTLGQKGLVAVTMAAMLRLGVLHTLNVDAGRLASLMESVASRYIASNSYHNAAHGADVAHAVYYMLQDAGGKLATNAQLRPETLFSCILAAAAHDVGHVGFNNQFLVTTSHSLAIQYNDSSPLENMHAATLFSLMQNSGSNPMRKLARGTVAGIRRLIIHIIMSTDNAMHFVHVGELSDRLDQLASPSGDSSPAADGSSLDSPSLQQLQWSRVPPPDSAAVAIQRSASVSSNASDAGPEFSPSDDEMLVLGMLVHACDISNTSRPWPVYSRWNDRVLEEFHRQGDAEKRLGLPVGPLNDRHANTPKCKVQAGFIRALVLPLFTAMQRVPELSMSAEVMPTLGVNLGKWEREITQLNAGAGQAAIEETSDDESDDTREASY